MRASVDPKLCIGCDLCADLCPDVFEMGEDGVAHVKTDPIPPELEKDCKQAAQQCPVEAIQISEID